MRGSTNITQRSGTVPVNGDIKEYVVADGNEIKVGDFVKYGTISSEVVLHDNSSKIYRNDKISDNNYLILQNNSLYLIELIDYNVNVLSVYNDYVIINYTILDDNSIVCCIESSPYVIRIKVENGNFVFLNSAVDSPVITTSLCCFYWEGYFFNVISYSSSSTKIRLHYYKVTEGYGIEYVSYYEYSSASWGVPPYSMSFDNGKLLFFGTGGSSSSSSSWAREFVYLSLSIVSGSLVVEEKVSLNLGVSSISIISGGCVFFDKYYVCLAYLNGRSTNWLIINLLSGTKQTKTLSSFGISGGGGYNGMLSNVFEGKYIVLYMSDSISIFEFSESDGSIYLSSNILTGLPIDLSGLSSMGNYGCIICYDNIANVLICKSNSGTLSYIYDISLNRDIISGRIDKNVVESYITGDIAIGFAKTGGTSGETIQVYVPKSN